MLFMRLIERGMIVVALLICSAAAPPNARPVQETTQILIVYAHDANAPGLVAFADQLKSLLREEVPAGLEMYDEFLDLDRFHDPDRSLQLARYFAEKYQGFR